MPKKSSLMDKLPNRKYVEVTWAAATTTAVYTQFDTMMGAREGAGWLVSRVDVQYLEVPPEIGAVVAELRFQLLTGAQTTTLSANDDEVICTIDRVIDQSAGGGLTDWPVSWVGPVLIASRELTCAMDGASNVAPFQASLKMLFTIWYQWVKLGSREWVEIAEARGIA